MHRRIQIWVASRLVLSSLAMMTGCNDEATKIAREASDRQAAQNRQMAELQHEVARGTHALVKSDAEAREKIVGVHRDLQRERKQLGDSWNELESERQRVDRERRSDSIWQAFASVVVGALVVAAFFGYLRQLLASAREDESVDAEVAALLVEHFLPNSHPPLEISERPEPATESGPPTALPHARYPTDQHERKTQ